MPSPAQGLFKQTTFGKQVALGTPKVGAGGQVLRRKTSVFQATRDTTTLDEITGHRQDTGVVFGQKKSGGKIDGNLSAGTYSVLIAGAMMKDFAATAPMTAGVDVTTVAGPPATLTDASAGFLTAGFKVGDVVRFTGFTTTATGNNARNFWITALTASVMTGFFLDGTVMSVKAPETGSVSVTLVGKKSVVPMTGHTNDFFTFEEWYPDKTRSEVYPDCKVNKIDFTIPSAGAAGISLDIVGLGQRTMATAQSFTTPAVETLFGVDQALSGAIYVNGTVVNNVASLSLSIDRGLTPLGASIGSAISPDFNQGTIKVSGSFVAAFNDAVIQLLYDAINAVSLSVVAAVDQSATSDFHAFTLGKIKLTGDTPDDGMKGIMRTYPFTAEINGAGGAALAYDQTILTIQDSQAV